MYKKIIDKNTQQEMKVMLRIEDNTFIPMTADNADYQQYLAWLAEGNEPEPADEQ